MNKLVDIISILAIFFTLFNISSSKHPWILLFVYLIHELGHFFFARVVGASIKKMNASSFRLTIEYDSTKLSYAKEILVCLGGIIFNLISALVASLIPIFRGEVADFFIICSLSLAIMNLYPITVLDGGGALKLLLKMLLSEERVEKISRAVSLIAVFLMWLVSCYLILVFSTNLSLFVISMLLILNLAFEIKK